jgi:14-3-3 protein epsilon
LIPSGKDDEAKVFYYKMEGDYHRYIAEFSAGDDKQKASQDALAAY